MFLSSRESAAAVVYRIDSNSTPRKEFRQQPTQLNIVIYEEDRIHDVTLYRSSASLARLYKFDKSCFDLPTQKDSN